MKKNFLNHETQREAVFLAHELMHAYTDKDRQRHLARLLEALDITPDAAAEGKKVFEDVLEHRRRKMIREARLRAQTQRLESEAKAVQP